MISQVSEDGDYWKVLDDVTEKEIISQSCHSLAEILMENTIKQVVPTMFGIEKDPDTWADDIKAYAFGN